MIRPVEDPEVDKAMADLANARRDEARAVTALHAAIRTALTNGMRQADLVRQTGYTRETLRKIAKADQG